MRRRSPATGAWPPWRATTWARRLDFEPTGETLELPADLVLIAIGFTGPERELPEALGATVERTIVTSDYAAADGVFAAGDARRGQSLIVTAIAEGRECARAVQRYLSSSN